MSQTWLQPATLRARAPADGQARSTPECKAREGFQGWPGSTKADALRHGRFGRTNGLRLTIAAPLPTIGVLPSFVSQGEGTMNISCVRPVVVAAVLAAGFAVALITTSARADEATYCSNVGLSAYEACSNPPGWILLVGVRIPASRQSGPGEAGMRTTTTPISRANTRTPRCSASRGARTVAARTMSVA